MMLTNWVSLPVNMYFKSFHVDGSAASAIRLTSLCSDLVGPSKPNILFASSFVPHLPPAFVSLKTCLERTIRTNPRMIYLSITLKTNLRFFLPSHPVPSKMNTNFFPHNPSLSASEAHCLQLEDCNPPSSNIRAVLPAALGTCNNSPKPYTPLVYNMQMAETHLTLPPTCDSEGYDTTDDEECSPSEKLLLPLCSFSWKSPHTHPSWVQRNS